MRILLFKRIIELSLCLWMEIKLVWMRDLGTTKAQGLPLSLPIRHSFFIFFFKTECSPLVSDRKKMPPVRTVKTWSEHSAGISISSTRVKAVLTCKTHCYFISLLFSLFCYSLSVFSCICTFSFSFFSSILIFVSLFICLSPLRTDTFFFYLFNSVCFFPSPFLSPWEKHRD